MARKSKKRIAYLGFTGVAAGAGLAALAGGPALAAPTAPAQPTLTARSGPSHTPYHGIVKGTNSTSAILASSHGQILSCLPTHATVSGSIPSSTFGLGPGAVTSAHATFTGCFVGGTEFNASLSMPASLSVTGYSPQSGGITKGILKHIHAVITGAPYGNSCHATVTGSLSGAFHNSAHTLVADPSGSYTLKITSTGGCGLTLSANALFQTTYKISTPASLSITSA